MKTERLVPVLVLFSTQAVGLSRPVPADVFREYMWWKETGDAHAPFWTVSQTPS